MIFDKDFLLSLDKTKEKEIYAKVTALTFQEAPITTIEGRITSGSINVDGDSAVRRTCSLSLVAENFDYRDYIWGLNTKFKLEIGVKNKINPHYPDIIWFNQGIFIITSFNTSRSTNNFNISLQGKDKMCLLNGDVGGNIESSVDFGTEELVNAIGVTVIKKIPVDVIIRNMIHHYAGEPYYNIIINDLDAYGFELLEYRYDNDLYLYRDAASDTIYYENILLNGNTPCSVSGKPHITKLSDLGPNELDMLVDTLTGTPTPAKVRMEGRDWYVAKIQFGQTAGYRHTDLTYPGDLIANAGETITSVLDKIKSMLSDFEYFYNLDGQFVFQKKRSFINTLWSPLIETDDAVYDDNGNIVNTESTEYVDNLALASGCTYVFSGGELITSFNNNPNLLNVKNDYSIWGTRQSIGRTDPVHMRYAIDIKPTEYITIDVSDAVAQAAINAYNEKYSTTLTPRASTKYSVEDWDWREIIYQMAQDYFKYAHILDDFEIRLRQANPLNYPLGITGYEQYYTDISSFWRQLYDPELQAKINKKTAEKADYDAIIEALNRDIYTDDEVRAYAALGDTGTFPESIPLLQRIIFYQNSVVEGLSSNVEEYAQLLFAQESLTKYQLFLTALKSKLNKNTELSEAAETVIEQYENILPNYYDENSAHPYWSKAVYEYPEQLIFWFDFIGEGELTNFSVKAIGARPKVVNDTSIKAIYFRETPDVIFVTSEDEINQTSAYKYIQVTDIDSMFNVSGQGKSAKDKLDELIYNHGYCIESVSINAVPVYYLEPNTRVHLYDEKSGLNGDYIVSKMTIPLTYNGTMQITATKAAENII